MYVEDYGFAVKYASMRRGTFTTFIDASHDPRTIDIDIEVDYAVFSVTENSRAIIEIAFDWQEALMQYAWTIREPVFELGRSRDIPEEYMEDGQLGSGFCKPEEILSIVIKEFDYIREIIERESNE